MFLEFLEKFKTMDTKSLGLIILKSIGLIILIGFLLWLFEWSLITIGFLIILLAFVSYFIFNSARKSNEPIRNEIKEIKIHHNDIIELELDLDPS